MIIIPLTLFSPDVAAPLQNIILRTQTHMGRLALGGFMIEAPRPGKRMALFEVRDTRFLDGYEYPLRRVMRVIERTIDKHSQHLLIPDIEIEGWWSSLAFDDEAIIALYADYVTSEQFHSEFKSDLDIERLSSGKFATNALVLACAAFAYNVLRWIGQTGLFNPDAPPRHPAKRRRLRTVMQELTYVAVCLIVTGRRLKLAFGYSCRIVPRLSSLVCQISWSLIPATGLNHNSAHARYAATSVRAGKLTGRGRRRCAGGGRSTCASTWSNSAG